MAVDAVEATESLPKEAGLVGLELATSCLEGKRTIAVVRLGFRRPRQLRLAGFLTIKLRVRTLLGRLVADNHGLGIS